MNTEAGVSLRAAKTALQVIRSAGGEAPSQVRMLVEGLIRRGIGAAVACPDTERMRAVLEGTGALVYPLYGDTAPAGDVADVLRLAALLRPGLFGLVHAHGLEAALVCFAAARLTGRVRTVCTAYGIAPDDLRPPLGRRAGGGVLRRYDCLVAVSRAARRVLAGAFALDPALVPVIRRGIEVPRTGGTGRGGDPAAPLVGMAAHLVPRQGVEVFLQAACLIRRERPRTRFLVAGGGPLWPQLRRLAAEMGLDNHLVFTGPLGDPAGVMSLLDVCVFPSRQEDLPLGLLDAMARSRPVVAADNGGVAEVVEDGAGILVPVGDATALAAQVVRVLNHPRLAAEMGRTARRKVLTDFGVARMQEETAELYRRVLAGEGLSKHRDLQSVPGA